MREAIIGGRFQEIAQFRAWSIFRRNSRHVKRSIENMNPRQAKAGTGR